MKVTYAPLLGQPETNLRPGQLEIAVIKDGARNDKGLGYVPRVGEWVYIASAAGADQEECIIRMDPAENPVVSNRPPRIVRGNIEYTLPLGNFISRTSEITDQRTIDRIAQEGLPSPEVVLYARWREKMRKEGEFPSMSEINDYFDPGRMGRALFYRRDGEAFYVCPSGIYPTEPEESMIEQLGRAPRVFLSESKAKIGQLLRELSQHEGLTAVRMERLDKMRDNTLIRSEAAAE